MEIRAVIGIAGGPGLAFGPRMNANKLFSFCYLEYSVMVPSLEEVNGFIRDGTPADVPG